MVYRYIAYNKNGDIVKGRLSAANEKSATDQLDYAGYWVIDLKPFNRFLSLDSMLTHLPSVKPSDITFLCYQLALLLESGIHIVAALELLQNQTSNQTLKNVLGELILELSNGSQLSEAMKKHPKIFTPICRQLVKVGEQTGNLEAMFRQIADYLEKKEATTKGIKNALKYPIIVSIVAILVIGVLVIFVLPAFGNLYNSLGAELPLITKVLIASAEKLKEYGIYLLLAILTIFCLAFAYTKTPEGRYKWDNLILKIPLVGRVNRLKEHVLCCRSLAFLFSAGLPLTEIMPLLVQGSNNRVVAQALTDVYQDMLKGEGLSKPMAKNPFFLPMMVQMIKVGEETGELDSTLEAVVKSYETQVEDRTRALIGLIQPALTLTITIVVGFIALSMFSAMYSIYGQGF